MGVGVTCLVGGRAGTKPVGPFADGKVARGASDVLSCTKGRCCCCVALTDLGRSIRVAFDDFQDVPRQRCRPQRGYG